MKRFRVVAGILINESGRVLIAERLGVGPLGGLWEFPGGKIDAGESAEAALRRELDEEIGIAITSSKAFLTVCHDYPDRTVELEFFTVSDWCGEPTGREGQRLRWVAIEQLDATELMPANAAVVAALGAE